MDDFIARVLAGRRPLKKALKDLRAKYQREPSVGLAEMIRQLEAEIVHRDAATDKKSRTKHPVKAKTN
jgi:hypothetical protein